MVISIKIKPTTSIARNEMTKQSEINVLRLLHPINVGFAMKNILKTF